MGLGEGVVKRVLVEHGRVIRKGLSSLHPDQEREIAERYLGGEPPTLIADSMKCSRQAVKRVLKRDGLWRQKNMGGYLSVNEPLRKRIISMYLGGSSRNKISRATGIANQAVLRVLREQEIPITDARRRRGAESPQYKGSWKDPSGYVHVYVPDDHQFASMRNGKHVLEHRLVMARHLGRCLFSSERVHHKNGEKTTTGSRTSKSGKNRIRPDRGRGNTRNHTVPRARVSLRHHFQVDGVAVPFAGYRQR